MNRVSNNSSEKTKESEEIITEENNLFIYSLGLLVIYTICLNLYFFRKHGYLISVNCWFCNKNSKVGYSKRNSFVCPHCEQYNGFNEDGGYNKTIDAQHYYYCNGSAIYGEKNKRKTNDGGGGALCQRCQHNLELKIKQLADFEPLCEANYDQEIEHFRIQLNKSYELCQQCTQTVKMTLRHQNSWIFGRFRHLRHLNQQQQRQLSKKVKKTTLSTLFAIITVIFLLICHNFDMLTSYFNVIPVICLLAYVTLRWCQRNRRKMSKNDKIFEAPSPIRPEQLFLTTKTTDTNNCTKKNLFVPPSSLSENVQFFQYQHLSKSFFVGTCQNSVN